MNDQYGIQLFFNTDPKRAKELLPPPLVPADPVNPMGFAYIVNIRQPTFSPWYMEGGQMCIRDRDRRGPGHQRPVPARCLPVLRYR